MPCENQAVWPQQWGEALQYLELRLLVKIYHHIAAKDRIQRTAYLPFSAEQI